MESLSLQPNRIPRDLLRRFMEGSSSRRSEFLVVKKEEDDPDEIELNLNLGLSLGGIFGAEKSSNKLIRSSSIAGPIPIARREEIMAPADEAPPYASLIRTSSLPVETEDEWRKRKELQSLRRMMAKRRRSEKQRSLKADKDGGACAVEEKREMNLRGKVERQQYITAMNKVGSSAAPPFRLPTWVAGGKGGGGGRSSSASVDSQGGSCSSMSESKPFQGSVGSCGDASMQSLQEGSNVESDHQMDKSPCPSPIPSPSSRKAEVIEEVGGGSSSNNRLENMPCVFTKGDGPNGRTIEGILYRYGKGEEVRIMCVCHATFHSPAEFVKHAGGTDVAHPLKHIVVNPNSSF
jgi:hypothetical protein